MNYVDSEAYVVGGRLTSRTYSLPAFNLTCLVKILFLSTCIAYYHLAANSLILFFFVDFKMSDRGKNSTEPTRIDNFCELTTTEQCHVTYCHLDVVCEVLPKGIDELSIKASSTEINYLVAQAKA